MPIPFAQVSAAIQTLRTHIQWKPNSLDRHLRTRKKRGHLAPTATSIEYEAIIQAVISNAENDVYLFRIPDASYVAVVESTALRPWLVMCDLSGLMETAFIIENRRGYLNKNDFFYIGTVREVLNGDRAN